MTGRQLSEGLLELHEPKKFQTVDKFQEQNDKRGEEKPVLSTQEQYGMEMLWQQSGVPWDPPETDPLCRQ